MIEREPQVTQRLITPIRRAPAMTTIRSHRLANQRAIGDPLGFRILAREQQLANLRQRFECLGIVRVLRRTRPKRILVELNPLRRHTAKHHRTQTSVADGRGLVPILRRLAMPDRQVIRRPANSGDNHKKNHQPKRCTRLERFIGFHFQDQITCAAFRLPHFPISTRRLPP